MSSCRAVEIVGIMEMLQDGFHDWSVAMKEYRLIRKDRKGRQEIIAPYVRE